MSPVGTAAGPRNLLRRLRDLMAGSGSAQERLDRIVQIIAADVVAEVCSVYVMRAGEVLELFATQGLNRAAVHRTRLRVGEGLIGNIAGHGRPLNLAEARSHPDFVYRPETGEEAYHSFVGVPIVRGGRILGVLSVQNRARRHYSDDELEVLQTVAMVVAELIESGRLVSPGELVQADGNATLPERMEGAALAGGLALGVALLHEPPIVVHELVADDPARELERLRAAVAGMQSALDELMEASDLHGDGEHRDVLESYRMFTRDRGWLRRITEAIATGLTAEAAVQRTYEDLRVRMSQTHDPYLRARIYDFQDLTNRLLHHLSGAAVGQRRQLPDDVVVVARRIGPAELIDYDRRALRAVVVEEGSPSDHAAIVARALQIPMVGGVKNAVEMVVAGDPMIVDGDAGVTFLRPSEDALAAFTRAMNARRARQAAFDALRKLPSVTRDGENVSLRINAGLLIDLEQLAATGADGIGLYRTELAFMLRSGFPDVAAQAEIYHRVLNEAGDKPVVFRTLDVGGDKALPYFPNEGEDNPAMGWRAIRIGLDRPALLRQQLRALIQAGRGRDLVVMFPLIAEVAEFLAARRILAMELARVPKAAQPRAVRVGAMVEVPALLWQLPLLFREAEFLSVGTNDLMQFMFATDRNNPRLAGRYDHLSPGSLSFFRWLAERCAEGGMPLGVCGEMAGHPLEAMALVGAGIRALSMPPASVGPVKAMVRSLDCGRLATYMGTLYDLPDRSVRQRLRHFARDHGFAV